MDVYTGDGPPTPVVVQENMTASAVCFLAVTKNRQDELKNWVLVEYWTDLHLGEKITFLGCSDYLLLFRTATRRSRNCIECISVLAAMQQQSISATRRRPKIRHFRTSRGKRVENFQEAKLIKSS